MKSTVTMKLEEDAIACDREVLQGLKRAATDAMEARDRALNTTTRYAVPPSFGICTSTIWLS